MPTQMFNFDKVFPGLGMTGLGAGQGGSGLFNIPAANAGAMSQIPGIPQAHDSGGYQQGGDKAYWPSGNPYAPSANSQYFAGMPLDPSLTSQFFGWLQSRIGKGVDPYSWSATMPSSGAATQPGQLTAPNNEIVQQMMKSFEGGPMADMLKTGMPIDQTPAWQAMVDSMKRQIEEGRVNLTEKFNVGGGLVGSPYGTAMTDYETQASKDLNAQLLGAQTNALEQARQRMLQATGIESDFGKFLQGLDQQSIDRLYQEFIRTSPEYNPLLNMMYGASTTFPPYLQKSIGGGMDYGQIAELAPLIASFFA